MLQVLSVDSPLAPTRNFSNTLNITTQLNALTGIQSVDSDSSSTVLLADASGNYIVCEVQANAHVSFTCTQPAGKFQNFSAVWSVAMATANGVVVVGASSADRSIRIALYTDVISDSDMHADDVISDSDMHADDVIGAAKLIAWSPAVTLPAGLSAESAAIDVVDTPAGAVVCAL